MATIELGAAQDGRTVAAQVGDEIVVGLDENATTGYRWFVERCSETLRLVSDGYRQTAAPDGPPIIGAGGVRELRFAVTAPGRGELALKYWQEWEGDRSITERVAFEIDASG